MFAYAYAVITLAFIVIWTALLVLLPRSRPAIFWTSLIFAPAGPVGEYWLIPDYWHPIYLIDIAVGSWHFGFEDYLITFAVAGISAGIFESLALRRGFAELPRTSFGTLLRMFGWGVVGFFLMLLLVSGVGLNSIHAILLIVMIASLLMFFGRWKILSLIVPISVIFGLFVWLFYVVFFLPIFPGVIQALWNLENTWGIMLAGVPMEELLWAFTAALFAGPVFRVSSTRSSRKLNPLSS